MKSQVRRVVLTAVLALLAPLAVTAVPAPAGADTVPVTTAVRVATFNVQVRRSVADFTSGVTRLLGLSDIIGLQEMDTRDKEAVLVSLAAQGWSHYTMRPSFQEPILWRSDRFDFVGGRVAKISDPTYIGGELPGRPATETARYVTVVRLVDRVTGRRISVVNAHLIQGAVKGGRPWPGRPRLWQLYKTGLVNLAGVTASEKVRWGRPFVLGDFNAGWVADHNHLLKRMPIRTFSRLGMRSMWRYSRPTNGYGTHNDALIDQVFSDLRPLSARVQFDISGVSDHWPAIASFPTS